MKKITIIDIKYDAEKYAVILINDKYTFLHFNTLNDLVNEIIFRTCIGEYFDIDKSQGDIIDLKGVVFSRHVCFYGLKLNVKQNIDIDIYTENEYLQELYIQLLKKGLKVNEVGYCHIDKILPKQSSISYNILSEQEDK